MRTPFDIYSPKTNKWPKMPPPSIEREKAQREIHQETQVRIEKLKTMRDLIVQELTDDNIPIDKYGKIDMKKFIKKTHNDEKLYYSGEVNQDQSEAIDRLQYWGIINDELSKFSPSQQFITDRLKRLIGEQFELLTFILLYKFLKEHFIVVRAALYDDHKNKTDLLLIDKLNSAVICLIITVLDDAEKFQIKKEDVWKINTEKNGVNLKYGLSIKNNCLIFKKFYHLPVFYFALSKERVKKHIDQLVCSLDRTSKSEDDLFKDLMWLLVNQIKKLDEFHNLHPSLRSHLEMSKSALGKIADLL